MKKIEVDKDKIVKLNKLSKEYYKILNTPHLTYKEIRRLQYLIKSIYEDKEKQKLYSLINIYNKEKDIFLKMYCSNLLDKLEKVYNDIK
jgi:predicted type IV restriction endonuclease